MGLLIKGEIVDAVSESEKPIRKGACAKP